MRNMSNHLHERFAWALEVLEIKPTDYVLEVGCGAGILAEQVAQKLTTGRITAIDKSEAMIRMASKRNHSWITVGKVHLVADDFAEVSLAEQYDKIFTFNVSVFWKEPEKELKQIRQYLKVGGKFYLFHQPPVEITKRIATQARAQLLINDFQILDTLFKDLPTASAFCIIAVPDENHMSL
jgi:ubiquinone/menaquinone biosynthesis C-methylase UbiE